MDVFAFREELVAEYKRFSRSFTRIRAEDISRQVEAAYAAGHFWPPPIIQLNPNFEPGGYIDDLVANGTLDAECEKVFRLKASRQPVRRAPPAAPAPDRRHRNCRSGRELCPDHRHGLRQMPRLHSPPSSTPCCAASVPVTIAGASRLSSSTR